jgi:DNA-binding CsgD family transcriptional regulator
MFIKLRCAAMAECVYGYLVRFGSIEPINGCRTMGLDTTKVEYERVALLSIGQRECLRLVFMHMSSKDIARALNISSHTVDQRLKVACRHLGVVTRIEAARALAAYEQPQQSPYQSTLYQSPDIAEVGTYAPLLPLLDYRELQPTARDDNKVSDIHSTAPVFDQPLQRSFGWPFPRYEGEINGLNIWYRLGWMLTIAITLALAFGMILAGLDALGRIV